MQKVPCSRATSVCAGQQQLALPTLSRPSRAARGPAHVQAFFRKQAAGASAGKTDKARQGKKPPQQQPSKQKAGRTPQQQGGGLMDMEVPVYAEAFDINKCVDLYLRFFKWVSSPVTGGGPGKK